MVMEAPPSPDSVGREFVRQYYTLLNKAPAHLHRFVYVKYFFFGKKQIYINTIDITIKLILQQIRL